MKRNVAVFGGSFNPPHVAHVMAVVYVLQFERVDNIVVVPCFVHPFAKQLAPFDDRYAMCEAAFGWIPGVSVSGVERELGGESRTLRTLQKLAADHPDWSLRLVVGSDVLPETPRWYGFDEIRKLAPVVVLPRPERESLAPGPRIFPDVSSSRIRTAVSAGDYDAVRAWVPPRVLELLQARGLYPNSGGG